MDGPTSIPTSTSTFTQASDTIVQDLESLITKYKQDVQKTNETTSANIKTVVKSYKHNLSETLTTLNQVPYQSADLTKPTEEFETLAENLKQVRHEGEQNVASLTTKFKMSVKRLCKTRNQSYFVNCLSNNNNHKPVLEYDTNSEFVRLFWIHTTNHTVYSDGTFGNHLCKEPCKHRPNVTIHKGIHPHQVLYTSAVNSQNVALGANPGQDNLWRELLNHYRP